MYWYTLVEAYSEVDLSLIYPTTLPASIFVLLWSGLVLQARMNVSEITGVIIVVFGAIFIWNGRLVLLDLAALRIEHVIYFKLVRQFSIVSGMLLGNYLLRELFGLIRVFVP